MDITPEFLEKCAKDDRKSVQYLYEHCFEVLMPVCNRYHVNQEDAHSSFNLGFIKILNGLKKINKDLNFGGWSKRIMVNTLIDEYRKSKTYGSKVVGRETDHEHDVQSKTSNTNDAESSLGYENILMLIKELPELSATVFNLYVIEGYAHKEIAEMLDMSEGTSKWHLSTARKSLREKLEKLENNTKRMVV